MLYLIIILFVIPLIVAYCYWKLRSARKVARRGFNLPSTLYPHITTPSREQRDDRHMTNQWQDKLYQKEKRISNLILKVEELSENILRLEDEIFDLSNENYRYNQLLQSPAILQDVNEFCRENKQLLDLIEKIEIDLREQATSYPAADEESELFVKRQICNYFARINPEQRCRWSNILKTLSYSKHIFDDRLKPSVMAETDPELKQRILRDHLYADVYASTIGTLLVTLEHLRNMHLFTRQSYSWKKEVNIHMDTLIKLARQNELDIHYIPLLDKLKSFEEIEIITSLPVPGYLPNGIYKNDNIVIGIGHYAVNPIGDNNNKTIIMLYE